MNRVLLLVAVLLALSYSYTQDAINRCHRGVRDGRARCGEYATIPKRHVRDIMKRNIEEIISRKKRETDDNNTENGAQPKPDCEVYKDTEYYATCTECESGEKTGDECTNLPKPEDLIDYPELDQATCLDIEWGTGKEFTADNNYGNCMEMTTDDEYRYITSNNVPDFYVNPYCPIGLGKGYCIQQEIDAGTCYFTGLTCGDDNNGAGTNAFGDVWVPQEDNYKILLAGDPTRSDRPSDMYDIMKVGGSKTNGASVGVAINGIGIQGPNDAGDVSIDEAAFQLACGGHVTPPLGNEDTEGNVPSGPPKYHFHKSPECLAPFTDAAKGLAAGGKPNQHAELLGWANDGFGIYAYQDVGGAQPVVDECGGHFGPVTDDEDAEVVYHYHSRMIVPYHLACQGPSLGKCADTQSGTNYCHSGCGFDVCVQPGTSQEKLEAYLDEFDSTWLAKYTVNPYSSAVTVNMSVILSLTALVAHLFM